MQDTITNRSLMDMAQLRVANVKSGVWPMAVTTVAKFTGQLENILFKIPFKSDNIGFGSFATAKNIPSQKKIFWFNYLIK